MSLPDSQATTAKFELYDNIRVEYVDEFDTKELALEYVALLFYTFGYARHANRYSIFQAKEKDRVKVVSNPTEVDKLALAYFE